MATLKFKNGTQWVDFLETVYPVGSVYLTFENTSPADLFGGTWTQLQSGRYLMAVTGKDKPEPGGFGSVTLDLDHTHAQRLSFTSKYASGVNGVAYTNGGTVPMPGISVHRSSWTFPNGDKLLPDVTEDTSWNDQNLFIGEKKILGNVKVDLQPPFQEVFCWRRTA